jgi:AcrR family transcriptional regulator
VNPRSSRRTAVQPLRSRLREVAAAAILEAAEDVFEDEGLHARMETIARRAGVAVGTLYNHFADRETLLRSLVDAHHAELLERL